MERVHLSRRRRASSLIAVGSALTAVGALVAVLLGPSSAGAQPGAPVGAAATTCPTDYSGVTVPGCSPSTTTGGGGQGSTTTTTPAGQSTTTTAPALVLEITYLAHGQTTTILTGGGAPNSGVLAPAVGGLIDWQACGYGSGAAGLQVQLELNGVLVVAAGGTGTVGADGCTSDPQIAVCLNPGTYNGQGNAVGHPSPTGSFQVTGAPQCTNPIGPAVLTGINASSPATPTAAPAPANGGALAFTGANVLRLLLIALAVIVAGSVLARASRRRRHGL